MLTTPPNVTPERFIVGTGRCGSTLLSRMLAQHPDVLSLCEFFTGLDVATRFSDVPIGGSAFAERMAQEQPFVTAVVRRGYAVEEITYPYADDANPHTRFRRGDPMPWILVSMLPRLSRDPDRLYDEVIAFANAQPIRRPVEHYRALFAWLGARDGQHTVIERSGSSVDYAADLATAFEGARFVHLHRAGPEVALSMREHHAYRLPISLIYDAEIEPGVRVSDLPPIALYEAPTQDDTITRILGARPDAAAFGRYWSDQIHRGLDAFTGLDPHHVLHVRFEALVAEPATELERIARFFELPPRPSQWVESAARLVRGAPRLRRPGLDAAPRSALDAACEAASRRLESVAMRR